MDDSSGATVTSAVPFAPEAAAGQSGTSDSGVSAAERPPVVAVAVAVAGFSVAQPINMTTDSTATARAVDMGSLLVGENASVPPPDTGTQHRCTGARFSVRPRWMFVRRL